MNQAHLLAILTALVGDRAFIQSFESGALPETLDYYLDLARRLLAAAEASVPDLPFNLDDLGDVVITSPATGSLLQFDGVNWVDTTVAAVMDPTYLRLDTANDPLSGDLAMGTNDITGILSLEGTGEALVNGGNGVNFRINPTSATSHSTSMSFRGIVTDYNLTSVSNGAIVASLLAASQNITMDGSTASPSISGYIMGGASFSPQTSVTLVNTSTNPASALLFADFVRWQNTANAIDKVFPFSFVSTPAFNGRGNSSGGITVEDYYALYVNPRLSDAGGGAVNVLEDMTAVFCQGADTIPSGWTVQTRRGLHFAAFPTSGSGSILNDIAVDVGTLHGSTLQLSLRSTSSSVAMRHVGDVVFGADTAPLAKLDVRGTGRFTDVVTSTVSTGTAPFTIASTTKVTNLNTDLLDDQSGAYYLDSANFTGTNWTDLTDGGGTTLHTHVHANMTSLLADDHTQYALLAGRSGGQVLVGGTAAADDLTLRATAGVGVGSENIIFQVGSAGATEIMRVGNNYLSIGVTSPIFTVERFAVRNAADTTTASGLSPLTSITKVLNPASSSASTHYNLLTAQNISSSCAQNFTGAAAVIKAYSEHNGSGTFANLQGGHFVASVGPSVSSTTPAGTGIGTLIIGLISEAWANSTNAGTTDTLIAGFDNARNSSPGTVTSLMGRHIAVSSLNGGSGAGAITNAYGLVVAGEDTQGNDTLLGGTIGTGIFVNIRDWSSGPTYTNPPEALRIDSQTATNAIAIRQRGTDDFNRLAGLTMLGADSNPASAYCQLGAGTTTVAPLRFTTTSAALLTSPVTGAMEFVTDDFYGTITTGTARKKFVLDNGTDLTSGRVPFATTNGRLTDDSDLTFSGATLTTTGLVVGTTRISSYNGISTVSNGVPSELATVDLTAQQATIAATTIYTPAASGLFRISAYMQVTQAASVSSTLGDLTITFTEPDGSVAQTIIMAMHSRLGAIATTATGNTTIVNLNGTMVINAKSGVAIQYAVGYASSGATPMQYALHMKVEAL